MATGWQHPDGRTIWALCYTLDSTPPVQSEVICWLQPDGHAESPLIRRRDQRPIVFTKPGDEIMVGRERRTVLAVEVFRGTGMPTVCHGADAGSAPSAAT